MARPDDGQVAVLSSVAALIWEWLAEWTTEDDLLAGLGERFPDVAAAERTSALRHTLETLRDDGLLDDGPS